MNGSYRGYLAAFSTVHRRARQQLEAGRDRCGARDRPVPGRVTVYVGGDFTKLDGVGAARAGAVSAATGALLPWAPALNGSVNSVAVAPDDSRVLVGGYFTTVNGVTQNVDRLDEPGHGRQRAVGARPSCPYHPPGCVVQVKDIVDQRRHRVHRRRGHRRRVLRR